MKNAKLNQSSLGKLFTELEIREMERRKERALQSVEKVVETRKRYVQALDTAEEMIKRCDACLSAVNNGEFTFDAFGNIVFKDEKIKLERCLNP